MIDLTDEDFTLLMEALEYLPHKNDSGQMMADLLIMVAAGDDKQKLAKLRAENDRSKREENKKKEMLTEDVRILQGKLLLLKRQLREKSNVDEASKIVNNG